jgi:anti-sigma B factor antagonist
MFLSPSLFPGAEAARLAMGCRVHDAAHHALRDPMDAHEGKSSPVTTSASELGTVDVGHYAPHLAIVTARGEHDLRTSPAFIEALQSAMAHSNVLVDFSDCSFIDSTVIGALVGAKRELEARGEHLVLVIPPAQNVVARLAALTQLAEIIPVHASRDAGLAEIQDRMRAR